MKHETLASPRPAIARLGQTEFIAMIAMLFATIAFSIDAMLPAMPQIVQELTPDAPNAVSMLVRLSIPNAPAYAKVIEQLGVVPEPTA